MENSHIAWTNHTQNFWIGCTKVSAGCKNCYAETLDKNRFSKTIGGGTKDAPVLHWGKGAPRHRTSKSIWNDPFRWNKAAAHAEMTAEGYGQPYTRPRVFCSSLADIFDDEVPIEWLADALKVIHLTPHLDWLLLTKRPENWRTRLEAVCEIDGDSMAHHWLRDEAPDNVWIGTSVEDQPAADTRIPHLLKIPARVRFLSCEPLLGPLDLAFTCFNGADSFGTMPGIHWVICGGESGTNAREFNMQWARDILAQCRAADVAFFMKQMGATCYDQQPGWHGPIVQQFSDKKGGDMAEWPESLRVQEFPS